MFVQETSPQPRIHHNLYNQFPSIEDARNSISEERQVKIGRILGAFVPEIMGKFGTTLTHGHHALKENEVIIGELRDGNLVSQPKERIFTSCPITWVVTPEELLATEFIDNASPQVLRFVSIIEKRARTILQHLPLEANEKFSKLSVTIDPREICNTKSTYFIENNDRDISILSPQEKKEVEIPGHKVVPTYKSIDSFQGNQETSSTWCIADCIPYGGYHYYSHTRT